MIKCISAGFKGAQKREKRQRQREKQGRQACQSALERLRILAAAWRSRGEDGGKGKSYAVRVVCRENSMSRDSHGLIIRKELAAEIGAGSTTVKVANETPGALAG